MAYVFLTKVFKLYVTKSCISNIYYGNNPIRLGTVKNYDLKFKIIFFVVWSKLDIAL